MLPVMPSPAFPHPTGRLAPSPTGRLHLGNALAFLLAWLHVRRQGGSLVLRMEDIDPERSRPEFAAAIMDDLAWLGLCWDQGPDKGGLNGPYTQSQRLQLYATLLENLGQRGLTYPCYCTRKELRLLASAPHVGDEGAPYPGLCRSLNATALAALTASGRKPALRLNTEAALLNARSIAPLWTDAEADRTALATSEAAATSGAFGTSGPFAGLTVAGDIAFADGLNGPQRFSLAECGGDFALRRSDGVVAYQLAVAADDAAMGISEVVRGEDLLPSTPRQILLFWLMGVQPPRYVHAPLLHDAAGERLAKRHKALELAALRASGIAPAAITGYLAWLAGFLDRPRKAGPWELLPYFSLDALRGKRLTLPPDVAALLVRL